MPLKPAIGAAPFMEAALLAFAYAGTVSVVGFYELSWHFVNGGSQTKQLYKISEAENLLYLSYAQGKKKISLSIKMGYFQRIFALS